MGVFEARQPLSDFNFNFASFVPLISLYNSLAHIFIVYIMLCMCSENEYVL